MTFQSFANFLRAPYILVSAFQRAMHICRAHYAIRPSVRPSVCHTDWSVKNRQEVHHAIFTIQ